MTPVTDYFASITAPEDVGSGIEWFLGHDSIVGLYWVGDNLGEWDEFCYESFPWRRIDRATCWPVVQRGTTVPRDDPMFKKRNKRFG